MEENNDVQVGVLPPDAEQTDSGTTDTVLVEEDTVILDKEGRASRRKV